MQAIKEFVYYFKNWYLECKKGSKQKMIVVNGRAGADYRN